MLRLGQQHENDIMVACLHHSHSPQGGGDVANYVAAALADLMRILKLYYVHFQ